MNTKQIFSNNQQWVNEKLALDKKYFANLAKGQSPEFLCIGCSDSRVTAEALMGAQPGDIFVHRNVANVVPNDDLNVMSVVEYAVAHLEVKHVVVCGHYYCGGVKAAMESADLGLLNPWLRHVRDVYRLHKAKLDRIKNKEKRYRRLVELNVQEQCINLLKTPVVQQASKKRKIQVHGWVFDISSGKLIDLKIDFPKLMSQIREIYRLK